MKIQTLGLLTAVGALALTSAGTLASCSQPPIECTAGHGDFAVRYVFVSGDAACNTKAPETVGFQVYNPLINEETCETRGDDKICEGTAADSSKVIIGLQPLETGYALFTAAMSDSDATHKAYSVGPAASNLPDGNSICTVPTLSAGQQDVVLPGYEGMGGGGGAPPAPPPTPKNVTYEWTNLKLYVTAAAPGTQFTADLKYTKDGCTANFKAVGMYPAIDCSADDPSTPEFETDPSLCNANPDPDKGRAFGSGINPDFPTKCEPMIDLDGLDWTGGGPNGDEPDGSGDGLPDGVPDGALCVLNSDTIPALKP